MPELPEVETTRRGLEPHLANRTVGRVIIRNPALRWKIPAHLPEKLTGQRRQSIQRRGKYLLFHFANGWLIAHLGMSGSLRIIDAEEPPGAYDHFEMVLDNGKAMRLRDPRRFGAILWTEGNPANHELIQNLGIEPLSDEFNGRWLYDNTRSRNSAIKQVLMDSHLVVGVGNIYANEALFHAGINPKTRASRLGLERCSRLATVIKETLQRAIEAGGSSLRDFVGSDGNPGYFQQQYAVYGRQDEPCRKCGKKVRQIRQGQRSTFYCPICQK